MKSTQVLSYELCRPGLVVVCPAFQDLERAGTQKICGAQSEVTCFMGFPQDRFKHIIKTSGGRCDLFLFFSRGLRRSTGRQWPGRETFICIFRSHSSKAKTSVCAVITWFALLGAGLNLPLVPRTLHMKTHLDGVINGNNSHLHYRLALAGYEGRGCRCECRRLLLRWGLLHFQLDGNRRSNLAPT